MRRALSIHDRMTLVLGLKLYHGRFNKHFFLINIFKCVLSDSIFLTSTLILGLLRGSKLFEEKNHKKALYIHGQMELVSGL